MKEIKFRGFHKCENGNTIIIINGEPVRGKWVYGYYFISERDIEDGFVWRDIPQIQQRYGDHYQYFDVIPETIGQYTGLKDKNGKEIYESDVISLDCYSYEEPEDEYYGEVVYSNHLSSFCLRNCEQSDGWIPICELGGSYTTITTLCGNIHDNPELLKEVTDEA